MPGSPLRTRAAAAAGAAVLVLMAAAAAAQEPAEVIAAPEGRTHLAVTLYNQGAGLVFDRRALELPAGRSAVVFPGLPQEARGDALLVLGPDGAPGPIAVHRQRLDGRLPDTDTLLAASLGREIGVERLDPATGAVAETVRARVLAAPPAALFEIGGRVYTELPGRPVFDALPPGVTARPAWRATVEAADALPALTLGYLTGGLSWRAAYVATLSADGDRLALDGFATLRNDTLTAFPADSVKLVAGDVARVEEPDGPQGAKGMVMMEMARAAAAPAPADAAREQLGAFHLYTLDGAVTLPAGDSVQAALLSARGVPVETGYRLEGPPQVFFTQSRDTAPVHVETRLTFTNDAESGLGKPLPAGAVRLFRPDGEGLPQLVGADTLDHTGEGREVTLTLGRAFDVTAERVQTDYERLSDRVTETAHRVTLTNARPEPVEVRVVENLPGSWEILQESQAHDKVAAGRAAWTVTVPAKGKADLTYRARTQF